MILSFKQQFNQAIIEGSKIHTIREGERWRPGLSIQFYNNTRTKYIKKFTDDKKCIAVQKIQIYHSKEIAEFVWVTIEGKELTPLQIIALSKNDGFKSVNDFFAFFFTNRECTLFEGQIIHWTNYLY
jgi:hypothetical protein